MTRLRRSPARRAAVKLLVAAVLATAGVLTAGVLAGGGVAGLNNATTKNGTGGGGHNTGHDTTTAPGETNDTPPAGDTTTSPPLCFAARGGACTKPDPVDTPTSGNTDQGAFDSFKKTADIRALLHQACVGMLYSCVFGYFIQMAPDSDLARVAKGTGINFPAMCQIGIKLVLYLKTLLDQRHATFGLEIDGRADSSYLQVALTTPATVPATARCGSAITRATCARLQAAFLRYARALSASEAAVQGLTVAVERYRAAAVANSIPGSLRQSAAASGYAGEWLTATAVQQAAARALAAALRATHTDGRLSAADRQRLLKKLSAWSGIPPSLLKSLSAERTGPDELGDVLSSAVRQLPANGSFAAALSTGSPVTALGQLQQRTTLIEVAELVRSLTAQGALTAALRDTLLDDLRDGVTADNPAARSAALGRFDLDAGSVSGPAGALLAAAAQGQ